MPAPLDLTFAVLRGHPGREPLDLGISGLEEPDPDIQSRSAALLLELAQPEGFVALRLRFSILAEAARDIIRHADGAFLQSCWDTLRAADEGERLTALECLAAIGRGDALMALAEALGDPIETLRVRAAQALVDIARAEVEIRQHPPADLTPESESVRRRAVVEALLVALRNYRTHGQSAVLEALLLIDPSSHKLLLDILANPGDTRRNDLLGRIQHTEQPEVVPFLIKMSRDPRERLRDEGARLLEARRQDPSFHKALVLFFERAPAKYLQRLASECESIPWWPRDLSLAPGALHHHLVGFLREAQKLPLSDRVNKLTALLALPDAGVRAQAALMLSELRDPSAEAALWTALDDPAEPVQTLVVRVLAGSQHPQRDRILTTKLNHPFPSVSDIAREAVSREGFRHYLSSFSRMDARTRATAGQALVKLDPNLLQRLRGEMASIDASRRLKALQILDALEKGGDLLKPVGELMRDPDRKVRATAARSLGQVGGLDALQLLVRGLTDADRRVRANAIEALGQVGDARLGKLILPFLKQDDNRCRANAIRVLSKFGYPEATEQLAGLLASTQEGARLSGLWALSQITWTEGRACLEALARKDPSLRVRDRAARLLARGPLP